jgi:hypothetical protein
MFEKFGSHKLTLDVSEDSRLFVKKVEIAFSEEAGLDEIMNEVLRPILIAMSFTNDSISKAFNMNEFGEELESEDIYRNLRKDLPDFADGLLDPEDEVNVSGTESVNLKDCSDLDTNSL